MQHNQHIAARRNAALGIILRAMFVLFLFGAVFISSDSFNDAHVQPKYYAFAAGVLFFTLAASLSSQRRAEVPTDAITIVFTAFCAYLFARGLTLPVTFRMFFPLYLLAAYFLFRNYGGHRPFFDTAIALACIIQSMWSIAEFLANTGDASYHIAGSFDNSAGLAALLSMGVPFSLSLSKRGRIYRYIGMAGVAFPVIVVILSRSRAGIVALAAIALVYALRHYRHYIDRHRKVVITTVILAAILAAAGLFLLKKDSALGRVLVWRVSSGMAADNPVFGKGQGAFMGSYMQYQAEYFADNPGSRYEQLADNTRYAFNEYLRITIEYGVVGLALLILLLYLIFRNANRSCDTYAAALFALAVFSLFSYPLRYPPIWIVAVYCIAQVSAGMNFRKFGVSYVFIRALSVIFIIPAVCFMARDYRFETGWQKLYKTSLSTSAEFVLDGYATLAARWNGNPFFLYNYAALLSDAGETKKSIAVLSMCRERYNDYNVQMLLADNYFSVQEWGQAERHYHTALDMCPNRFRPMQGLLRTFIAAGKPAEAIKVAEEILQKEEKIPSYAVSIIKYEAETYIGRSSGKPVGGGSQ